MVRPPSIPAAELRPRGRRHSIMRDARAVRHHYNLSNDYFALFLDESMTYSCGLFSRGATTLEEAQRAKLALVCDKLALVPGQRVLDIGCGWGSFAIHAARERDVHVTGITLSEPQAELARRRAAEAGVADRVDIRVEDYRRLSSEPFDAVASIGMVEHVGNVQIDTYARQVARLVKPGGRVLNHGIARLRHGDPEAGAFSERYVFPDAAPLHLSRIVLALERAGLPVEHVEGLAADYAETLRHWARRFDEHLEDAVRLGGAERVRASGGSICAPRGADSRAGSPRCIRCAARARLPPDLRRPAAGAADAAALAGESVRPVGLAVLLVMPERRFAPEAAPGDAPAQPAVEAAVAAARAAGPEPLTRPFVFWRMIVRM